MRTARLLAGWVLRLRCLVAAALVLAPAAALAGGPRWSAGKTYFSSPNGQPVLWNTTQPQYYTDPGDLSTAVNHAAADQMVAAAASTWNVSISSIVLGQGGALNEHVSSANVYLGPGGPVFPADVQASNGAAKPIAIIYDTDGSVTDTLLGGGASDPGNCRQSAVTESVDGISPAAQITHALIVLNGRCTGTAPELQMEMKYRLIRAFGRVLGFGWSQTNENVWTASPAPTYQQALHWPLMHPVDILCGPYAYQCVVQPFTLKTDDIASIASLYPVTSPGNGKTATYAEASYIDGAVHFANGQGMQGVNVVSRIRHQQTNATDTWESTSSVTGYQYQQVGGNPVVPKGTTLAASFGSPYVDSGYYNLRWLPTPSADLWDDITVYTQTINPLYTGQYAVGPYQTAQVIPSGPALSARADFIGSFNSWNLGMTATNGAGPCSTPADGAENAPATAPSTGLWSSTMCGYGHTAWSSFPVKAGRTLAVEVTSLDDSGYATTGKLQPVMGLWDAADPVGSAPTQGAQTDSLNTTTLGMTSLLYASGTTARTLRLGLGDARGDGRPDFQYNARVLYANTVSPATLPANGGRITISGMGFRNGNAVTVNGVAANVVSWAASSIVAVAPAMTGAGAMDVTVTDLSTGSQTTMSGALGYTGIGLPNGLAVVSSPANGSAVGAPATPDFTVAATLPDGVTPAINVGVRVSVANGTLGACAGAATCVLTTDAQGQVTTPVTPLAAGTVTLTATLGTATVTATFTAVTLATDVLSVTSLPSGTVYAGVPAAAPFGVQVMMPDRVTPAAGVAVAVSAVNATLGCGAASCTLTADGAGSIATAVTPLAAGTVSLLATAMGGMVSASFGATALPPDVLRAVTVPANGSFVGRAAGTPFGVQVTLGDGTTAAAGATVLITATRATLGACGGATCVLTADGAGMVSTTVVPTGAGTVTLTGSAGGGSVTATFTAAAVPADTLQVLSVPANGSYLGRVAAAPFTVQVSLGDTGAAAAGVSVTLTTSNGTLGACGAAVCFVAADGAGRVSTTVTPATATGVTLTASAGGATVSATFTAVAIPPDTLQVVSIPADGSYVGQAAAVPFGVQVALGDTGGAASGVPVTLRATGATLGCGASSCVLSSDAAGALSTVVTPVTAGPVVLVASGGGGSVSATFTAALQPPDRVQLLSAPANGSVAGVEAGAFFLVKATRAGTGAPAAGIVVVVSAINATMTYCGGRTTCWLTTDGSGVAGTPVTPTSAGLVVLSATEGGGSVSTTFTAVSTPVDRLRVVSQPTAPAYAGLSAANPFAVQVMLPDGTTPAAGVAVTVSSANARLAACSGAATCVLTADGAGNISTGVTPVAAGLVTLSAAAGGGTASASFGALTLPPDTVRVVSSPSGTVYVGQVAATPFAVQVMLGDGTTPAAGVAVTLSSQGATFGACPAAPCVLTADGSGMVSTPVTPTVTGPVTLTATAGGVTASASFASVDPQPDTVRVLSAPADGTWTGQAAAAPFRVQVMLPDGTTPAAGVPVTLTASGASLAVCGGAGCVVAADGAGIVSTAVTPASAGPVVLRAAAGGGSATITFQAVTMPPDSLQVTSTPADGSVVGTPAAAPFAVRVLLPDGISPAAGASVSVTASGALLGACAAAVCTLTADAAGRVQTTVTPQAAGTVTITAAAAGGMASTSFTAVGPPDVVSVLGAPTGTVYAGYAAGTRFSVQVYLADGVTPAAGVAVDLSAVGASLAACGAAACTVNADGLGMVSTAVTPTAAGMVTLTATAGGGSASATFVAVAAVRGVTAQRTVEYVAPGVTVPWVPGVMVSDRGAPAAGVSVAWTVDPGGGIAFTAASTVTDGQGATANPAAIGPLGIGASASAEVCAWGTTCAPLSAVAVDPERWRLVLVSGGTQDVTVASTLAPVSVRVVDDAGDWVAGASVNLRQVVDGWVDCPVTGRCPIPPVLAESAATLTSDVDGMVTATPLEVAGVKQTTRIVLAAGPHGYVAITLAKSR